MNRRFAFRSLTAAFALAAVVALLPTAGAHPDDNLQLPQPPGGPTPPVPTQSSKKPGPVEPSQSGANDTLLGGAGTDTLIPPQPKRSLQQQRLLGYKSNVLMLADQITHAHRKRVQSEPVEFWYVSTRKAFGDKWMYCVVPRVEVPGTDGWLGQAITITLLRESLKPVVVLVPETQFLAGASVELPVDLGQWCATVRKKASPPSWTISTDHGSAKVRFPRN